MKRMREFDDILNECIERVLKGESVEACLKAFPEHAAELETLLRTVQDAHKAAAVLPRPEFRQQAAYEFQKAIRDIKPLRGGFFQWHLRWVTAVSVMAVILLAGSGTVAASANSLPDESLYSVKLFTEEVRLALTPSALGKAELYTELIDTRVAEIVKMADKGKADQVVKTTVRMNDNLVAIARIIQPEKISDAAGQEPSLASRSVTLTNEAVPGVTQSYAATANATVATANKPGLASAASQTPAKAVTPTRIPADKTAVALTPNTSAGAPVTALNNASISARDAAKLVVTANISKIDDRKDLTTTVSRQAEKNTQQLEEVLKRVPDSLKPAIEEAIKVAEKGYSEALKDSGKDADNNNAKDTGKDSGNFTAKDTEKDNGKDDIKNTVKDTGKNTEQKKK